MTFGMRNAGKTLQRFMATVFQGLDFVFFFVDDVLVSSFDELSHKNHLEIVFERLNKYGITINLSKCSFGKSKIEFLGFEVTSEGITPLQEKVQAIVNYPRPETVQDLRRFLGMVNFYRAHIPNAVENQVELNKFL